MQIAKPTSINKNQSRDRASKAGRSLSKTLVLAGFLGVLASSSAYAERSFSAIQVDASALGNPASSLLAREIKATMEPGLRNNFASNLRGGNRNSPRLVVRITAVTIQSIPEFARGANGGYSSDFMEGEALVVGRGGVILQRFPMLAALNNNVGGWYLPDYEKRKIQALSNHYAWWLKRQMPEQ